MFAWRAVPNGMDGSLHTHIKEGRIVGFPLFLGSQGHNSSIYIPFLHWAGVKDYSMNEEKSKSCPLDQGFESQSLWLSAEGI